MGLKTQMTTVPSSVLHRLPTPAIIRWQEALPCSMKAPPKSEFSPCPERGLLQRTPLEFEDTWGTEGEVLLLEKTAKPPNSALASAGFCPPCAATAGCC
jgi:subfamily B ATP-binding cassette protein HlyB/CyaB